MVKWVEAVDPSLWDKAVRQSDPEALLWLSDAIRELPKGLSAFVVMDYEELSTPINYDRTYLLKLLADIDTIEAGDSTSNGIKSEPDIISSINDGHLQKETLILFGCLAGIGNTKNCLYVIESKRIPYKTGRVSIIKDDEKVKTCHPVTVPENTVAATITSLEPSLNQGKHYQFERNLGKGKKASKFSAYNIRNEEYARNLLHEAFIFTDGEIPVKDMYAWDSANETYVRFMHSGNNEYHGFDIPLAKCPQDIREKFGH